MSDDLIQIRRPEIGRPNDPRIDDQYLAERPELGSIAPFDPEQDVDLVGEINNALGRMHALARVPQDTINDALTRAQEAEQVAGEAAAQVEAARALAAGADSRAADAQALAEQADTKADSASTQAQTTLAALTLTRAQLLTGAADPGNVARVWDEHGSLRVRARAGGETPDNGITFALAGNRMAEREWDGKNVYTAWYGLKPGDDVSGYIPALAAVPEGGVLHWTPGKYMHSLAGYAGKGDTYNPLHIRGKNRFTMKMAGVVVEAAPNLPNTTYYGGWAFYGCQHYRVEGWPVYDGRLDVRDAQQFHDRYHHDPVTGIWGPDTSSPKRYGDPGWALLWLDGWRVELGCVGSYLEVEARRCLMDGILTVGNCVDTYLYRCVSSGNFRQGLSAVGVDGLTIDGGIYELTGKTKGPDGQERGTLPMAGMDLEGEADLGDGGLKNRRVQIINRPEFRHNRGSGLMVHQYTQNTSVESAHIHHNDGYGLNVDGASVGTVIGPGVLLEMNGQYKGPNYSESFEVNLHGQGAVLNGVQIVTDAHRAINAGGTKVQHITNVSVKVVGRNEGKSAGWITLSNPHTVVDGLSAEGIVPQEGHGAVHIFGDGLTTGAIRNCRIRAADWHPGPAIVGKALSASNNETVGYSGGNQLTPVVDLSALPRFSFADGDAPTGYTDWANQDVRLLRQEGRNLTYRMTIGLVWDKKTTPQLSRINVDTQAGMYDVEITQVSLDNADEKRIGQVAPRGDVSYQLMTSVPAFAAEDTGLWLMYLTATVTLVAK